jgi:hypothetical protein
MHKESTRNEQARNELKKVVKNSYFQLYDAVTTDFDRSNVRPLNSTLTTVNVQAVPEPSTLADLDLNTA